MVVLGHIIDGCVARGFVAGIEARVWTVVYDVIYSFHMPLFMLISGYLYSKYVMKNWKYVLRKTINLISIYVMISILYIGIRLLVASNMKSEVNFKQILLLPIMPVGPYWYLWVLIIFYLLFYVGFKYTNKKIMWLFSICISIIAVIVKCQIPNNIYQLMFYSLFFYVGIEFETIYKLFSKNALYSLFVTILAAISMVLFGSFDSTWCNLVLMFCTAIFVLGLIGLSRMTMIHSIPIVPYLGKNTMIVYLYHVFL